MRVTMAVRRSVAGKVPSCGNGIDKASIEEYPACEAAGRLIISQGQIYRAASEGGTIDPRQCRTTMLDFILDDATTWLFDYFIAAPL